MGVVMFFMKSLELVCLVLMTCAESKRLPCKSVYINKLYKYDILFSSVKPRSLSIFLQSLINNDSKPSFNSKSISCSETKSVLLIKKYVSCDPAVKNGLR